MKMPLKPPSPLTPGAHKPQKSNSINYTKIYDVASLQQPLDRVQHKATSMQSRYYVQGFHVLLVNLLINIYYFYYIL
uniref:Uncharacterized protein n=1 Tax=Arundo donax TaxID=35708 RepID=A0A0A9GK95_ARUDO